MVITPFGGMRLHNYHDEQRWLMAHKLEHKRLNMGALLDGPVDAKWMIQHYNQHRVMDNRAEVLKLPGKWRSEQEMQTWHLTHNLLHKRLGAG